MSAGRSATVERKTKETAISVRLDLDGSGLYDVQTQNPFLTHMVETWTRYAGFDVRVRATGDLDHHLVEDVAIALGQAFRAAFALAPCQRIAFDVVPMDDALVLVAVDLVDRPYYEGLLPIPLWEHFLRSFAMEARINLHVDVRRGRDTHHVVEASLKAFARALRRALAPRDEEISTKGTVRAKVRGASPATAAPTPPAAEPPEPEPTHTAPHAVAETRRKPNTSPEPLSIEDQELLDAVARDPAEEGWSWRKGVEESGVRREVKDPEKGTLEVRSVAKDGRPRLERKPRAKKGTAAFPDSGTVVAPGQPPVKLDSGPLPEGPETEEAGAAHVKPESLVAANKEMRSSKKEVHELPEVKAARERHKETHKDSDEGSA